MIVTSLPIWLIDVVGSVLMIVLSFMCLLLANRLRNRDRNNVIWTYLLLVCFGLAGFAISRSAGHIVKQLLLISGQAAIWAKIQPFSGAINTISFVFVGSVTLFFERVWRIYSQIEKDKHELQHTRDKLIYLNQNLENLVTERTKELAVSEHNYRRIFEVSRDMIVVTDLDGRILNLNPAGYRMLGYDARSNNLIDAGLKAFFNQPSDWLKVIEQIEQQGYLSNAEIDLKHKNGSSIRSLISGNLDRSPGDGKNSVHFLVKDIEQRRLIEDQIAQADKLASIGQLSAGIAHEINNPLGIILGYTQLLIRHEPPDTEKYSDLKTIEKHVRNCKAIVEDLLNFARTSKPREDLIRIDEAVDDVLKFVQQHADLDHVIIRKNYDPDLPEMLLDEKKIKQVLMNLIMNARHAIQDNGTLGIRTRFQPESRQVAIEISDNGYGIEKKNLSRIFDPFFTTKPTGEGTGLGLSVSYGIVKNHGGDIAVESEVGQGTTFTITLPTLTGRQDN